MTSNDKMLGNVLELRVTRCAFGLPMLALFILAGLALLIGYITGYGFMAVCVAFVISYVIRKRLIAKGAIEVEGVLPNGDPRISTALVIGGFDKVLATISDCQRTNRRVRFTVTDNSDGRQLGYAVAQRCRSLLVECKIETANQFAIGDDDPVGQMVISTCSSAELQRAITHLVERGWKAVRQRDSFRPRTTL